MVLYKILNLKSIMFMQKHCTALYCTVRGKEDTHPLIMRLVSKHMQGSCPRLVDETTKELIATGADDINNKLTVANKHHRMVCVEVRSY